MAGQSSTLISPTVNTDLSNRIFENEAAIDQTCKESWNKLTPERLKTITETNWLTHEF